MAEPPSDLRIDWGADLWDKNDVLIKHMKKGADFCENLKDYFAELANIEIEYSIKLKRLHDKCFPPAKSSKKSIGGDHSQDDDIKFSHAEAFREVSNELSVIANQHAEIGDKLNQDVVKDLKGYVKELKIETQRLFTEAEKYRKELESYRSQLEKSRDQYERAHRDTLKATEMFRKTDADVKAAKIDVEKCRQLMNARQSDEDKAKQDYAEQQQSFNRRQRDHYYTTMPTVHRAVQAVEEKRILRVQETLHKVHACHQGVISIINKCIANMATHTTSIQPATDLLGVVRKYESGEKPPGDLPFYDLSPSSSIHRPSTAPDFATPQNNGGSGSTVSSLSPGNSSLSLNSGIPGSTNPPRPTRGQRSGSIKGSAEDFSDLPPAQQVRRLRQRVEELEKESEKERKACEGLLRMLDTFKSNEKGGDIGQTQKMLEMEQRKRKAIDDELDKFRQYLADAQQRLANAGGSATADFQHQNSTTASGAAGLSTPRTSNASNGAAAMNTPLQSYSQQRSVQPVAVHDDEFDDEFDDEPSPIVSTQLIGQRQSSPHQSNGANQNGGHSEQCRMLYDYAGDQPGTLRVEKGEVLEVLERDPAGDQWTKVRRLHNAPVGEIGFVPTQYISIESTI